MAFVSEIKGARSLSPAFKRYEEGGKIEEKWGTFASDLGSTGGEIDLECDKVLFCVLSLDSVTPTTPRCQLNTATDGKVTITTNANAAGRFKCLCQYN